MVVTACFINCFLALYDEADVRRRSRRSRRIFSVGKSRAQIFDKDTNVKLNFNDVAGLEEAKTEVMEIVDFLKNPKKYTQSWRQNSKRCFA